MANSFILKQLIDKLQITVSQFEREIKVGASTIDKGIKRDTKIKEDTVDKIVNRFPQVNREWLLAGKLPMFNTQKSVGDEMREQKAFGNTQRRKIPVVGEALAGTDMEIDTTPVYTGEYIDVGDLLRDSDAAFTVYGNSS